MTRYDSFGPFKVASIRSVVNKAVLNEFWSNRAEDSEEGLYDAVGIYIIAVQARSDGPYKPWYVGRTDKQGFKNRLVGHELLFRKISDEAKNGNFHIFFVAMRVPKVKGFRKPSKGKISQNDWLESTLIGTALSRNRRLLNVSNTKKLKTLVLPGIMNSPAGAISQSAQKLRQMLEAD